METCVAIKGETYRRRFHQTRHCSPCFRRRKDPCRCRWSHHTRASRSHRGVHLCSAGAEPSSPWSACHSSSQPTSNHKSASPGQRRGQEGTGWLAGPIQVLSNPCHEIIAALTPAVHWMTSLHESSPAFSRNNSPELFPRQSFCS